MKFRIVLFHKDDFKLLKEKLKSNKVAFTVPSSTPYAFEFDEESYKVADKLSGKLKRLYKGAPV